MFGLYNMNVFSKHSGDLKLSKDTDNHAEQTSLTVLVVLKETGLTSGQLP